MVAGSGLPPKPGDFGNAVDNPVPENVFWKHPNLQKSKEGLSRSEPVKTGRRR